MAERCAPHEVYLRGDWGTARFSIEVADTIGTRSKGLMHREALARSAGMLFVFGREAPVSFWMRNTLIPLDMIFIDEDGIVTRVHENAVPLDETQIPSGGPVLAVLEVNGGLARALGIEAGSQVLHPAFGPEAAWACAK